MTTPYTATSNLEALKLKAWTSTASGLTDPQLLTLLNDSLRSYLVPFVKRLRDEWFVSGGSTLTPNSAGRITIPNSIGSTVRTVSWNNNGTYVPLDRIEPENALPLLSSGGATPIGYTLKGYQLQIIPAGVGAVQIFVEFMERPAMMVLESDALLVGANAGGDVWNSDSVPVAWQEDAPSSLAVISPDSPFSELGEVDVVAVTADTIEVGGANASLVTEGAWLADVGSSPFPNVPIELHPLLQQDVICTLFVGLGDKRLKGAAEKQVKLETDLRATIAPRTQGSARPIVNKSGPGWATGRRGR